MPTHQSKNASFNLCILVHHLWMVVMKCLTGACGGVFLEDECYSSCGGLPPVGNYEWLCMCTELGSPPQSSCPCQLRSRIDSLLSATLVERVMVFPFGNCVTQQVNFSCVYLKWFYIPALACCSKRKTAIGICISPQFLSGK